MGNFGSFGFSVNVFADKSESVCFLKELLNVNSALFLLRPLFLPDEGGGQSRGKWAMSGAAVIWLCEGCGKENFAVVKWTREVLQVSVEIVRYCYLL